MNETTTPITLIVNGYEQRLSVGKKENLLEALRRLSLFSVKRGCDTGGCGVCVVLLDGKPIRSCVALAVEVNGQAIT
ncbi:MAG: 2Fe-2S iron-sulfur cluster-binding protein, partial [Anaerolineales bacterium]